MSPARVLFDRTLTMNTKNNEVHIICRFDIHDKDFITPKELIHHMCMTTISRKGIGVFAKDHKYVVLRDKKSGAVTYVMVYNHEDTDFGLLAELVMKWFCCADTADYIGQGTFALSAPNMGNPRALTLFFARSHREESVHYLDALRDEVRQALADSFGVAVQIQFDLRAISMPRTQADVLTETAGK